MDLGTLLVYAVGGYLVYTNWSAISAWFGNLSAQAPAAVPGASPTLGPSPMSVSPVSPAQVVAPSSAGTLVPLAPVASTPPPIPAMPPTTQQTGAGLTVASSTVTDQPAPPAGGDFILMRPAPLPIFRTPQLVAPAEPAPPVYGMPRYRAY